MKTLDVVGQRLVRDGFVMRYDEADDFGHPETAFLVCTFWYVDALALAGRRDQAREIFNNVLAVRNGAGLLSEDVMAVTRTLWGNFPQAYSHVDSIIWRRGFRAAGRKLYGARRNRLKSRALAVEGAKAGGLTVALKDVFKQGALWLGWSGEIAAETATSAKILNTGKLDFATIDLSEDDYRQFYVGFANSVLWPLLHFQTGLLEFDREDFAGYLAVNRTAIRTRNQ